MKIKLLLILFTFITSVVIFSSISMANDDCDSNDLKCLQDLANKLTKKIDQLNGRESSLSNEIEYINAQISLIEVQIRNSTAKINKTENDIRNLSSDIDDLSQRIDKLEVSIGHQLNVLALRMRERYKNREASVVMLLGTDSLGKIIQKSEYLLVMERHDNELVKQMRKTKDDFNNQKRLFEEKKSEQVRLKAQLVSEKAELDAQKGSLLDKQEERKRLLEITQNDEAKYKELLDQTRAEIEAINAVLGGKGIEGIGAVVKAGQRIATVISGYSCNSGGTHLHFAVRKNGSSQNPFGYLKKIDNYTNCSGTSCSSRGDSFNPSGDWNWPLSGKITLSQGYGSTWAVRNTWVGRMYSFHDGIDLQSQSLGVYAVAKGTYYKGYYIGSGGCRLQYVRLDHKNGIQTYYLHVSY